MSLADAKNIAVADFFGIATGNKMPDKFERSGLHAVKSAYVNAPIIEEFPVVMECELAEGFLTMTMTGANVEAAKISAQ